MQNLNPEQAQLLLQLTIPALKNEHAITRRVIEAVPPSKCDYRPDQNSKSAFELAWHIASAENMFLDATATGEFHFGQPRPESVRTIADVSAWYAENFGKNLERVSRLSADQLLKIIDFRGVFQLPAVLYLDVALKHSIHHRGQLSVYLRPMDAKVPSIYGESYDDAQARKAGAAT